MSRPARCGNDPDGAGPYDVDVPPHPTTPADLGALPTLDLADFRQWLIDNGGAMRLALDAANLTDAEVEARLAAAHAAAERYEAERAQVAAEFGVRPDQITLRGCSGERGEEWG